MKKLLFVMLVLGMASMANAQMYLTINGVDNPTDTIEALAGDVLTIDIYGDGETGPSYIMMPFVMDFFMDIGGVYTWDIGQVNIDYMGNEHEILIYDDLELNVPFVWFMLGDLPLGTNQPMRLGPTPNPLIDTILLTLGLGEGLTEDNQTITLYDGDLGVMQTYDVHITPEPTTMCLLGFGGLALLRKRRA